MINNYEYIQWGLRDGDEYTLPNIFKGTNDLTKENIRLIITRIPTAGRHYCAIPKVNMKYYLDYRFRLFGMRQAKPSVLIYIRVIVNDKRGRKFLYNAGHREAGNMKDTQG